MFGLVKKICLPDQMSGKNMNTFANTDCTYPSLPEAYFAFSYLHVYQIS